MIHYVNGYIRCAFSRQDVRELEISSFLESVAHRPKKEMMKVVLLQGCVSCVEKHVTL